MKTKLICTEGLPGSGKSSTAQFVSRELTRLGIRNRWWYEEELGHPAYVYDDAASAGRIVDDLNNGRYRDVIAKALLRWERFAQDAEASDELIVIDGCLLGYLTWSLFPINVAESEISAYLESVETIIERLDPCLIYLYQDDVEAAIRKIMTRRGPAFAQFMIERASESPYGKARGLSGYEGAFAYWKNYRAVMDRLYGHMQIAKLKIENHLGDWPVYYRRIKDFLGLEGVIGDEAATRCAVTSRDDAATHVAAAARDEAATRGEAIAQVPAGDETAAQDGAPVYDFQAYAGSYSYTDARNHERTCTVQWVSGALFVDGLPEIWTNTRLLPNPDGTFDVASLPYTIRFTPDAAYPGMHLQVSGPDLLDGTAVCVARRISESV